MCSFICTNALLGLKSVLPFIINESQAALVPGCQITDKALLAFEIFHMMKLNKARAHGSFAFKLDMAKAYERVERCFLDSMLRQLGFHYQVVDLIMRCVTSVSFRVLVNGFSGDSFIPSRGLRQGDPLSPFLFLFCAEALSGLLRQAETRGIIHGAHLCRSTPRVSHLLFADDCIIFGRANSNEIDVVKDILWRYEGVSGQKVNLDKSEITFSSGIPADVRASLALNLGVECAAQYGKYLGIPSTVGRSKSEIFQMLVDRVRKKAKDWKRRYLSGAGKTVLIKTVLQSILIYLISCFDLPTQICQRLNSIAASFFWGQNKDERRIHWKSWSKLCRLKMEGRMGFRDNALFNKAMLAKQSWRILNNGNTLLARSLKARYFPRNDLILVSKPHNPSFTWKSLLVGRDLLLEGITWKVGDGSRIRMGLDRWLPDGEGNFLAVNVSNEWEAIKLQEFIHIDSWTWDRDLLAVVMPPSEMWKILAQLQPSGREDLPLWPMGKFNAYTVRSGYLLACSIKQRNEASSSSSSGLLWKWIWNLDVIPKVKHFLWRCLVGAIPTAEALISRSLNIDPMCRRCGNKVETLEHALRDCAWASFCWEASPLRLNLLPHKLVATAQRAVWTKSVLVQQNHEPLSRLIHIREGQIKVSCDAAFKAGLGVGVGVVFSASSGDVVGCFYGFFPGAVTVEEGEALAALESIHACVDRGFSDIILHTDCQNLFWRLHNHVLDPSYVSDTTAKILRLSDSFTRCEFRWTPRDENAMADCLAKFALSSHVSPVFLDSFPNVSNSLVMA
ncbi:uncharacterized protein LOC131026083 [Salvia miltiorrhiza]|uniref:uncharacterized protein LOC131026083 n=1 Tax=Salvia miltiorrhiza TaxID=226208 RepID=UPI0025AC9A53|nr:uncharacterized protein LOC131026083 [Salvia miltiorrhiza]